MDIRDLMTLAGLVNPELLNKLEAPVEEADGAGFDNATTRPEEAVIDDPMQSMGSDVDLSLRRYLKAKGDHVTVDEADLYPDLTVEDVTESYAAFKEAKAKPDFADIDGDGDKEEPMKKAAKDKEEAKESVVSEGRMKDMIIQQAEMLDLEDFLASAGDWGMDEEEAREMWYAVNGTDESTVKEAGSDEISRDEVHEYAASVLPELADKIMSGKYSEDQIITLLLKKGMLDADEFDFSGALVPVQQMADESIDMLKKLAGL